MGTAAAAALLALSVAVAYAGSAGSLDRSFGDHGQFVLGRTYATGTGLDIGRSRRIVFAGQQRDRFVVSRLLPTGRLDSGFGNHGVATVPATEAEAATTSVAIDRRGGMVLAGMACTDNESSCDITVYRLNRTGQLNHRFGHHGSITLDFPKPWDTDPTVALAPKKRILVEASTCPAGGVFGRKCDVGVARLRPDGSLDRTFGDHGISLTGFKQRPNNCGGQWGSSFRNVSDMALDSKHRIALLESCAGGRNAALARLKPNGHLDRSFGRRGRVYKDVNMQAAIALTTDSHDRIDVAGPKPKGFAVARFRPTGKLDSGFGKNGTAEVTFASDPRGIDAPTAVGLDSRHRIVAAGQLGGNIESVSGFVRFKPRGGIDKRFGHRGGAIQKRLSVAWAAALDPRNRIVALGWKSGDSDHMKLLRVLG